MTDRHSTISCLQTSVLGRQSSVVRPPADCPSCPFYQLARKAKKTFFTKRTQIFLIEEGSQILLVRRLTKATLHFRYQENEPKPPE
ncbi:MAG: hypothetical protein ACYTEL_26020, partial [Planctomycetota bacterium]